MKKVLVLAHGTLYSGAQRALIEQLKLLRKTENISLHLVICRNSDKRFLSSIRELGISFSLVSCNYVLGFPVMDVDSIGDKVVSSDVVWISDIEYVTAPKIKSLRKNIRIVAHLHSYSLVCPLWRSSYGLKEICTKPCSLQRFISCLYKASREMNPYIKDTPFRENLRRILSYRKWREKVFKSIENIDAFIAVSNAQKKIIISHAPQLKDRIYVVYNPIPNRVLEIARKRNTDYNRGDSQVRLIYPGGSRIGKGPHILLKAVKEVIKEHSNILLYCIGSKGTFIEKLIYDYGLREHVIIRDYLEYEEYLRRVTNVDAVLFPSILPEPLPYVPLEANALGIPVIASDIGGLPEIIIDKKTGILVKPYNHQALINGIVKFIDNRSLFNRNEIMASTLSRFNNKLIMSSLVKAFGI